MTAILAILRANPLAFGLGAALLLSASAFGVQTWRLGNAQERIGALQSGIQQCAEANRSQMQTLDALRDAQADNEAQRVAALEAQRKAAQRARELQQELDQKGDDDVQIIERTVGNCLDEPVPDPVRLRFARGSDQDADRGSDTGADSTRQ